MDVKMMMMMMMMMTHQIVFHRTPNFTGYLKSGYLVLNLYILTFSDFPGFPEKLEPCTYSFMFHQI